MDWVLPAAVILVPLIGMVAWIIIRQRTTNDAWSSVAQKHGLTMRPDKDGDARMEGMYRGRSMTGELVLDGRLKHTHITMALNHTPWASAVVAYNQYGLSAKDRESARRNQLPDLVDTGDADIDRNFLVQTASQPMALALFADGSGTRDALVALHRAHFGQTTIDGGMINFVHPGRIRDAQKMQHLLDVLSATADAVEQLN